MSSNDQDFIAAVNKAKAAADLMKTCAEGDENTMVPAPTPYPSAHRAVREIQQQIIQQIDPTVNELADVLDKSQQHETNAAASAKIATDAIVQVQSEANKGSQRLQNEADGHSQKLLDETNEHTQTLQTTTDQHSQRLQTETNQHSETLNQQTAYIDQVVTQFGDVEQAVALTTEQADRATTQAALSVQNNAESAGHADRSEAAADRADLISGLETVRDALRTAVVPIPDFHLPLVNDLTIAQGKGTPYQIDVSPAQDGSVMVDLPMYRAEFSRASKKNYLNKWGQLVEAAINEPAFEQAGILLEGSSTNLLDQSIPKESNGWTGAGWTETSENHPAPDGSNNAVKVMPRFRENQVSHDKRINSVEKGTNTFSVFAKAGDYPWIGITRYDGQKYYVASAWDLTDGRLILQADGSTSTAVPLNNGWWRLSVTATTERENPSFNMHIRVYDREPTSYGQFPNGTADGTKGLYVWGAQVEKSRSSSSYIPTAGAPATRAADRLSIDNKVFPASITGFTIAIEIQKIEYQSDWWSIYSSSDSSVLSYGQTGNGSQGSLSAYGTNIYPFQHIGLHDSPVTLCFSISKTNCTVYVNGVSKGSATLPNITHEPLTGDLIVGGHERISSRACWADVRNLRIWNGILSPEQISNL